MNRLGWFSVVAVLITALIARNILLPTGPYVNADPGLLDWIFGVAASVLSGAILYYVEKMEHRFSTASVLAVLWLILAHGFHWEHSSYVLVLFWAAIVAAVLGAFAKR